MKNCAFVLLFIIFCWGCSNMEVGVEEDVFSATGMNLPIEDLTVEDILLEGAPDVYTMIFTVSLLPSDPSTITMP